MNIHDVGDDFIFLIDQSELNLKLIEILFNPKGLNLKILPILTHRRGPKSKPTLTRLF